MTSRLRLTNAAGTSRAISKILHVLWTLRERTVKSLLLAQTRAPDFAYRFWTARQELAANIPVEQLSNLANRFKGRPFVTFNVFIGPRDAPEGLVKTLESLWGQSLGAWEAQVYYPLEREKEFQASLDVLRQDRDIRCIGYTEDQKERLYSTSIAQAAGEFVCWVQVGGAFAAGAVAEIALREEEDQGANLFYYDEDVLQPGKTPGQAHLQNPLFKPGWSPALLLSVNYLRGSFYRKTFLTQVLGEEPAINCEWDLALRCSPRIRKAVRVARVLFHAPEGAPPAGAPEADPLAEREALTAHLERQGLAEPRVRHTCRGFPRLEWKVRDHKISIIIPTKDNPTYLQKCIASIQVQAPNLKTEIIIIDTGSQNPAVESYYQQLATDAHIRLMRDDSPFNYSRVNNLGAARASGDLLLFLNNDVEALQPGWIEELTRWMEYPGVGVVGPRLVYPDHSIQHAGIILGMEGHASHIFSQAVRDVPNPFGSLDWYRNYQAVTGACMMTSRSIFEQVGGFDEAYILVFSDVEYCLRVIRQGYRVMYTPFCELIHYEGKSRARYIPPQDIQLGCRHFIQQVREGDPYYHPGLSYSVRQPVFAWGFEQDPAGRLEAINRFAALKTGSAKETENP